MSQEIADSRPQAFLSYAHVDDRDSFITGLCSFLAGEMYVRLGRPFEIFQDVGDIQVGQDFDVVIEDALDDAVLFIPILTPGYFASDYCRRELRRFLKRAAELGRNDLILPIYFVDFRPLNDDQLLRTKAKEYDLEAAVKRHQWVDWRELRKTGATTSDFRTKSMKFADGMQAAVERVASAKGARTVPAEDNTAEDIKRVLDEIRIRIQSMRFRRRYKAGITLRVLTAARDEIQKLTGSAETYTQDLSIEENFIVRAGPIFSEASEVYAVSIDELSQFWIAHDQRTRAQDYTSRQPLNTVRLFVFSSVESAQRYRFVLAAHYARYGKTGGAVLMCSRKQYQMFWAGIDVDRVPDLLRKDFAVLVFRETGRHDGVADAEYYEATLSSTKLVCRQLSEPQGYHCTMIEKFDRMRDTMAEGETCDGITKWREDFKYKDETWMLALARLFNPEESGGLARSVYHIVFFSADVPSGLAEFMETNVRPRLQEILCEGTETAIIEDFWFGSRSDVVNRIAVLDGIYKGTLWTSNVFAHSYPAAMVVKFRSVADLRAYYADLVHAEVRRDLLSFCDPDIRGLYELLDSPGLGDEKRSTLFHAVEAAATRYMLRTDFALDSPGQGVLQVEPAEFELPVAQSPSIARRVRV